MSEALVQSFVKLNPKTMFLNPVMFTVEIGAFVMLIVSLFTLGGDKSQGSFGYNFLIFIILLLTVFLRILPKQLPKHAEKHRLIV